MAEIRKKGRLRKILVVLLVLAVVGLIVSRTMSNIQRALFSKKSDVAKKAAMVTFEDESIPIKVFNVKKTDFKDTLPCMGTIKGFKEIELKFQAGGIIESFNFEEGEKIQEGDIIASLVQRDALLKLKYAEYELTKIQKLFELGSIAQQKLEQTKLEYESAKSDLDKTNIYASSNGLLGSRTFDVGSNISPGDKVGIFVSVDKVYAEFEVIERDIPKVSLGQRAEVFIDALPARTFNGVVDRIAPIVEGKSRAEKIKVELDNKDGVLKPGYYARSLISTYEKKDALVIPSSGLKKRENTYVVYVIHKEDKKPQVDSPASARSSVVKEDKAKGILSFLQKKADSKKEEAKPEVKEKEAEYGTSETRKVRLGYMTQDLVEVEEGLAEDELIVVELQEELKDKAKVEIMEVQEGLF